jgi:tetratricopeptide (TPR) repeat protein
MEYLPDLKRPLDQLNILIEGKQALLRQGEGLIEPGGQLRFDFDALEHDTRSTDHFAEEAVKILQISRRDTLAFPGDSKAPDELLAAAFDAEDAGDLCSAVDYCHAVLARDGPRADICFQLGELLYRNGEHSAARERYFIAIELDPEFVEARASLGNLLAEEGRLELAVAAFQGALALHEEFPDVHYSLAQTLESLGRFDEAKHHWLTFLEQAPQSPWADEARNRLERNPLETR